MFLFLSLTGIFPNVPDSVKFCHPSKLKCIKYLVKYHPGIRGIQGGNTDCDEREEFVEKIVPGEGVLCQAKG